MDCVYSIFYTMRESTWIQNLYMKGSTSEVNAACLAMTEVYEHDRKHIPIILTDLYESSWADELELYKPYIISELGYCLTVMEMRNIYLTSELYKTGLCYDVCEQIASLV